MKELEHRRHIWQRKPVLRLIYNDIYDRISKKLKPGLTLEIGAGSGNSSIEAIKTDVQFMPWLDVVCDAQRLPFKDDLFSNIVIIDVIHHIEYPSLFFAEAQRTLKEGGRIIAVEPAITLLSWVFYKLFHHEPVDMSWALQ